MKQVIKKAFIAVAVVAGIAGLIFVVNYKPPEVAETPATSSTPTEMAPPAPAKTIGRYRDGTYTGSELDLHYGSIQVSVVITDGNIASITMLKLPNEHSNSRRLAAYATPILIKEAIAAQSAEVDIVSGATETSNGFIDTLQSALSQANPG